jgi:hypothetical protein
MPWAGFEPTRPVFERAKTVIALYRAVTVISSWITRSHRLRDYWLYFYLFICLKELFYCHVNGLLKKGFGLVIVFIDHLQVVTTINYYKSLIYTINNHSTLISSFYLQYTSQIYNKRTTIASLNYSKFYTQIKSTNHTLSLHKPTSNSSTTNFPWLSPTAKWLACFFACFCRYYYTLTRNYLWTLLDSCLYSCGKDRHHRKHMSRDHYPLLCDVTADTENTSSSNVVCWTVLIELLPGNALIKSVTLYFTVYILYYTIYTYLEKFCCAVNGRRIWDWQTSEECIVFLHAIISLMIWGKK